MLERPSSARRALVLLFGLALAVVYAYLPTEEQAGRGPEQSARVGDEQLEIFEVRPPDPTRGSAVVIHFVQGAGQTAVGAALGRTALEVLERAPGRLVVRVPSGASLGHHKLRIVQASERSKPFDLAVRSVDWRRRFRNLVGGLALVLLGLRCLGRAASRATGFAQALRLRKLLERRGSALVLGGALGAVMQSAPSVGGLLGALVGSNVMSVGAAGVTLLGAQLGAIAAPWALASLLSPSEGLLIVAIGSAWLGLAGDRRGRAVATALVGSGLMLFGLHVLRPGFEPLLSEPWLLVWFDALRGAGVLALLGRVTLGAGLALVLQGPTPVLLLAVSLAETTGFWDLRASLSVLGGAALGSALGSALAVARGARGRGLGLLVLGLGAWSTLVTLVGLSTWCSLSDVLVRGLPHETRWAERVLHPNLGQHLALAFGLSQLAAVCLAVPWLPALAARLERWLRERESRRRKGESLPVPLERELVRRTLVEQGQVLWSCAQIAATGSLALAGRAERALLKSRQQLEAALAAPIPSEASLQPLLLCSLQLQSALELTLRHTERLAEARLADESEPSAAAELPVVQASLLGTLHELLKEGFADSVDSLERGEPQAQEAARAREIRVNAAEARLRTDAAATSRRRSLRSELALLEVAAAYEATGNQLYRLAQLTDTF